MSLQVWLPLNGTIENKGLASEVKIYANSGKINNSGKTGKAYRFVDANFAKLSVASKDLFNDNTPFSLCSWVYLHSYPQCNYGGSGFIGDQLYFTEKSSGDYLGGGFGLSITYNGYAVLRLSTNTGGYDINFGKLSLNTWYHLCGTFDGNTAITYLNGKKIASLQNCGYTVNGQEFYLGRNTQGGWGHPFDNSLNDVRIYDHALSPKEVKEISKGLCLHYRLSGHGCENLITNSQQLQDKFYTYTSSWEKSYKNGIWTATCTAAGIGGPHTPIFPKTTDKIGKTYTFSCLIRSSRNIKLNIGHECGGFKYFDITPSWQRITNTWVFTDASSQSIRWYALNGVAWNVGDWFQVKDFKIEEGDKATPWIPNSSDSLYSSLGYNSVVEPDCSGFGNDGVKVGDISCNGDTARYITSYKFDSGKDYIKSTYTNNMETFTVSYWIKPSSLSGRYATVASNFNNDTRCWFGVNTENSGCWFFNHQYCQTSGTITNDKWHHCVFVFDKRISKWYVDGKEAQLSKNTLTDTSIQFSNFTIGNSYTGTEYIRDNYCGLSDFRIYATALSAEDVLDLYQTGASIDNGGNAWAYEYKEVE